MLDNLTYHYDAVKQNRLLYVSDALAVAATPISLESQASDNYGYDEIGRIIKDKMRGITAADWTLANKPREMTTDRGIVKFRYDAMNEKIYREEYTKLPSGEETKFYIWYVRDASGNILSIYSKEDKSVYSSVLSAWTLFEWTTELKEQPLYGSSRVGTYKAGTGKYHRTLGHTVFELSNHLGNVLSDCHLLGQVTIGKSASDLCRKTYCASKSIWYYGVKIHLFGGLKKGTFSLYTASERGLPTLDSHKHAFLVMIMKSKVL